jgi:hypothetical protein
LGISLEEPRVVMKYLGGIFIHIQRQLQLHGVKIIDEALSWTPGKDNNTWAKKKPTRKETRR